MEMAIWRIYHGKDDGGQWLQSTDRVIEGTEEAAVGLVEVIQAQLRERGLSEKKTWYIVREVRDK
jgi:hypothetical protein